MKMNLKTRILGGAIIAACTATTALISAASGASIPSSPAEMAATAQLNHDVTQRNAAEGERYRLLQEQYLQSKAANEALQDQYQANLNRARDSRE